LFWEIGALDADVSALIKVRVPGKVALAVCNPYGRAPDLANLVSDILRVWSYWLAYPEYRSETFKLDCGMVFREPVASTWIEEIISIEASELLTKLQPPVAGL
jgi:hypothetical protein